MHWPEKQTQLVQLTGSGDGGSNGLPRLKRHAGTDVVSHQHSPMSPKMRANLSLRCAAKHLARYSTGGTHGQVSTRRAPTSLRTLPELLACDATILHATVFSGSVVMSQGHT